MMKKMSRSTSKRSGEEMDQEYVSFISQRRRLPWSQRLCYGVGHMLNDLSASLWFSYLMVYLQFILGFDTFLAGIVLMVGQVADAVVTPLIGYEGDVAGESGFCLKYGRRKCLHLIGTLAVIISFPFIFTGCPVCPGHPSNIAILVLLIPLVCIFQFGWATTQVAHLALIPDLTEDEDERDLLNIIRYSFDVIADVMVYVVAWLVLDFLTNGPDDDNRIGFEDSGKFVIIVWIITAIGTVFSIIFHIGVKEMPRSKREEDGSSSTSSSIIGVANVASSSLMTWSDWMKEPKFYHITLLFTTTRLFHNFTTVFIPLYLQESLGAHQDMMAKIPLVLNLSGFASSLALKYSICWLGKKASYVVGVIIGAIGCVWIASDHGYPFCAKGIYGVAVLLGFGSSAMIVCSLSFIPDLIGNNVENGAFVYGAISFFDKMTIGISVLLVQYIHGVYCNNDCHYFYRYVMAYVAGGIAIFSAIVVLTINTKTLTHRSKARKIKPYDQDVLETEEFNKRILTYNGYMRSDFEDSTYSEAKPLLR